MREEGVTGVQELQEKGFIGGEVEIHNLIRKLTRTLRDNSRANMAILQLLNSCNS
jgi:hypothetical protein